MGLFLPKQTANQADGKTRKCNKADDLCDLLCFLHLKAVVPNSLNPIGEVFTIELQEAVGLAFEAFSTLDGLLPLPFVSFETANSLDGEISGAIYDLILRNPGDPLGHVGHKPRATVVIMPHKDHVMVDDVEQDKVLFHDQDVARSDVVLINKISNVHKT